MLSATANNIPVGTMYIIQNFIPSFVGLNLGKVAAHNQRHANAPPITKIFINQLSLIYGREGNIQICPRAIPKQL